MSTGKIVKKVINEILISDKTKKIVSTVKDNRVVDAVKEILSPTDSAVDAYLYIGVKKYEIQSFETEFSQGIDFKGQPQHEVKGGLLAFTLRQATDEILNRWMFQREIYYDGVIAFAPISRTSSPLLKIIFNQAHCISYQKIMGTNMGMQLRLLISAKLIKINNIDHKNGPDYPAE